MPKIRNDYTVLETRNYRGEVRWKVRIGGSLKLKDGYTVTTCKTKEDADYQAQQLNIDPYFFSRGQTRAEMYPTGYKVPENKE
jgi:hypothetical protein